MFPNTHEALISREDFQKVQDILQAASEARQTSMQKTEEIRATPVSYTHLDVYKRQTVFDVINMRRLYLRLHRR